MSQGTATPTHGRAAVPCGPIFIRDGSSLLRDRRLPRTPRRIPLYRPQVLVRHGEVRDASEGIPSRQGALPRPVSQGTATPTHGRAAVPCGPIFIHGGSSLLRVRRIPRTPRRIPLHHHYNLIPHEKVRDASEGIPTTKKGPGITARPLCSVQTVLSSRRGRTGSRIRPGSCRGSWRPGPP